MSSEIIFIVVLLLLNAFFALSEMAIVSASKPLLRQQAKQGRKSAQTALDLAENSGRFLSTVQVGITLVGTLAGAFGGATIAEKLTEPLNQIAFIAPHGETVGVILVVTLITYFSVVIGELVPKQLALNNAENFAMMVSIPMAFLSKLCTPIVMLLEVSAQALMTILRIKPKEEGVTETEIKAVIAEGVASGAIEDDEHDVIRRVIRLGDRDVKSIMTHRTDVQYIDINDTLDTVRDKIAQSRHSRYPVIDKDTTKVLGVIDAKHLMASCKESEAFQVAKFMTEIWFIHENTSSLKALKTFRQKRSHMAAVIDEYGAFEGLFTASDLLEAIVGTMPSNYDENEDQMIVRREDGSWLVDGLTPIEEIHITIGLDEIDPQTDYKTLAGFMLNQLRSAAKAGEKFTFAGHVFEILDMDGHRIDKILIQKVDPQA